MAMTKQCNKCGSPYRCKDSEAKFRKFCSRLCASHSAPKRPSRKVVKTCKRCGNEYSVKPSWASESVFCSKACQHPKTRVRKKCLRCGAGYEVIPSMEESSKYCSEACKYNDPLYRRGESVVRIGEEVRKICRKCKIPLPLDSFAYQERGLLKRYSMCNPCKAVKMADTYASTRTERLAKGKKWQTENRERANAIARKHNQKVKAEAIKEYGGRCACCGETEPKFLSVDHIYNDGAQERRETSKGGRGYGSAGSIWRYLRQRGYPKDRYQLLCFNCNCAKGFYGQCPHQGTPVARPIVTTNPSHAPSETL